VALRRGFGRLRVNRSDPCMECGARSQGVRKGLESFVKDILQKTW